MKLWGGRFSGEMDPSAWEFNASIDFDKRRGLQDVRGSIGWARALGKAAVISTEEAQKIINALKKAIAYGPERVCILSDNSVGSRSNKVGHEQLLKMLAEINEGKQVTIDTIQFFYRDPRNTLQSIAEQHGGVFEFIAAPKQSTPASAVPELALLAK